MNNKVHKIIIFLFLTTSISVSAQITEKFDYIGNLTINDSILLTYRLKFNLEKDKIIGYSYTDIQGSDETKSRIIGKYDKKTKEFNFSESEILYTKSIFSEGDFCFINGIGKLSFKKNKSYIKGKFIGKLPEGNICAKGKYHLISLKSVEKKLDKLVKKVTKINQFKKLDDDTKNKFKKEALTNEFKPSVLKKDENLSIFWNSNKVLIEIWDNQKEDGDKITISVNGESIITSYEIKNKKKLITLDLKKGKNTILITAIDEGFIAPNTATINLIENNKTINVTTSLKLNETTRLTLIY